MESHQTDQHYMRLALRLAAKAQGMTSPNPLVGAVVVNKGRVIGSGYHHRAGWPHAEVNALQRAGSRARGGTLYVTLEPCNHYGRTPPCSDAVIASGISRVVIGAHDPNPLTNGRGLSQLRRAGLRVRTGVLAREAQLLNAPFEKAMRQNLPYTIAKIGQSLDGKIATVTGESRWITSPAARRLGHAWRAKVDAILVGSSTVVRDDSRLTVRHPGTRRADRPIKVVVDSRLRVPLTARCFSTPPPAMVATTIRRGPKLQALKRRGVDVVSLSPRKGRVPLRPLFNELARRGVQSVLIEGGGEVLASALTERLVDRIIWCTAPILIGGRRAPSSVGGSGITRLSQAIRVADTTLRRLGPDWCLEGRVVYPKA